MKTNSTSQTLKTVGAYLSIIAAAVLLAFNYRLFIVGNNFAPAGINGIATMIQDVTGFSIGYMTLLINIPLCLFAFFTIGKNFAIRSFVFSLTYSFVYLYLQKVDVLDSFRYLSHGHDTIYPVLISGIISGFVYGVCFRTASSTGGTHIVSRYVSIKKPNLNFFWVTFAINAVVAVISLFVYSRDAAGNLNYDYKPVCLCILYCYLASFVGDFMIKGTKSALRFTIITTHPEEITEEIRTQLKHGCTQISAVGSYSNELRSVLICVINRHQLVDFKTILSKYDNTFSFSETVNETYGNFKLIR